MSETEHSALPWRIGQQPSEIVDVNGCYVTDCEWRNDELTVDANAALIVRAVNAHKGLVRLAEDVMDSFRGSRIAEDARLALAAAKMGE